MLVHLKWWDLLHRLSSRAYFLLIYVNYMAEYTKHSSVRLFADYTIIYLNLTAGT